MSSSQSPPGTPDPAEVAFDEPSAVLDSSDAGGRIIRGGALRLLSYVLTVALSILSAALLTRHLGVGRFGDYTTVLSLVGVVSAVTDAGMSTVGQREFAVREGAEREELMRDLLGLRIVLTAIGVLLVTVFALAADYDAALLTGAILAGIGTVALVVQHTHTIPLAAALRLGTLSALDLARQVLSVAALVALVLAGAGVLPLLAVALAVNLLLIPPTAALARHQISLRFALRPRRWAALLRLTVSFSLAAAVGTIYVYTAQILTSLVSNPHQNGLFAASFRVFVVVAAVPGLLVGGALPLLARAARDDRERLSYSLQRIFEVSLILGVAAAIGTLGGAHFIVEVVAGAKFEGATEVLQLQGLALISSFVVAGWSFALLSLKLYKGVLLTNLAAFVVSCSLTAVLAASDGARGAAIATICGEGVLALGSLIALAHDHPELWPKLGVVVKVVIAAAPAVALALLPDLPSLVCALLALLVYAVAILAMRAVPAELIELLPSRLRRIV
ncbi:MAG TPA: oligosaccharide flippase family protein [Solirubrobacteraceae bacterium]|nr:oligosaccharide flippase family protein [Solirubrobacteraceae bacterium]